MWSDEMDKEIRAASESVHRYDEKNWKDMEVLLDKHLPQQKRRRRIIFFILFALIGLGLSGYLLINQFSSTRQTLSQQKNIPASVSSPDDGKKQETKPAAIIPGNNTPGEKTTSYPEESRNIITRTNSTVIAEQTDKIIFGQAEPVKRKATSIQQTPFMDVIPNSLNKTPENNNELSKENNIIVNAVPGNTTPDIAATKKINSSVSLKDSSTAVESKAPALNNEKADSSVALADKKEKPAKQKSSKFGFSVSFGPDLSSAGLSRPGQLSTQYGIGISYAISEKWNIRTGLYASRKLYSADSNSYHGGTNWSTYNYKLHTIDANCFVYEIPLTVVYNFDKSKRHNWFVSAGLSSYFMNTESYKYIYKNQTGQTRTYTHEYKNENSHILSVASLSGGYRYHLSKNVSLMAEPYFKAALGGIGDGKVRLNNAGVLFTATFNPFKK
jgi:hypothetical protein